MPLYTEKIISLGVANYVYAQLQEIIDSQLATNYAIIETGGVYSFLLKELTRHESQFFPNNHAKIIFVFDNYKLPTAMQQSLQKLRYWVNALANGKIQQTTLSELQYALRAVCQLTHFFAHQAPPDNLAAWCKYELYDKQAIEPSQPNNEAHIALMSVIALSKSVVAKDADGIAFFILTCQTLENETREIDLIITDTFTYLQPIIWKYAKLNFTNIWLQNPTNNNDDLAQKPTYTLSSESLVALDPDCLVDASTIANCRLKDKANQIYYLIDKFHYTSSNIYFLRGNVVNEYLDRYMAQHHANIDEIFDSIIQQKPTYALLFDENDKETVLNDIRRHITTLHTDFVRPYRHHIISLEPTFISDLFGLRGRLDILVRYANNEARKDVIELKSSKDPKNFGQFINPKDALQATCYNLLLDSVYQERTGTSAILYSGAAPNDNPLRNAPNDVTAKRALLKLRNYIVWFDYELTINPKRVLDYVNLKYFENNGLFANQLQEIKQFRQLLDAAKDDEAAYFYEFTRFTAREHRSVRVGAPNDRNTGGFAALWNQTLSEKERDYSILAYLYIVDEQGKALHEHEKSIPHDIPKQATAHTTKVLPESTATNAKPDKHSHKAVFTFAKTKGKTHPIAAFRTGDFVLLYPQEADGDIKPTKQQVIKASIRENTADYVLISPINQYITAEHFAQHTYWAIEPELNEIALASMYQSLRLFLALPDHKKDILLGKRAPQYIEQSIVPTPKLTEKQNQLLQRALSAQDYFLLQGPPGTGKTKVMLRELVDRLLQNKAEKLVLLAYTNRAVDEICESLHLITPLPHFIRLGYGDTTEHKENLLSHYAKGKSLSDIRQHILSCRVIVATVLTWMRNPELSEKIQFTTAIIDEASQLLEPQVVGILGSVKRFILIGDEKQLPAVVTQNDEGVMTNNEHLNRLGIHNVCVSIFERLLKTCQKNQWQYAYGMLEHQGRMHRHIQQFPNQAYYDGLLQPITARQDAPISDKYKDAQQSIVQLMAQSRTIFVNTPTENRRNTNQSEAQLVADIVCELYRLLGSDNTEAVGIITPYRAQIAEIQNRLPAHLQQWASIDTVERYQGSQRDIIIISTAVNHAYQLKNLHVLNDDGKVDKKLNVALTRAREHIILIGNSHLLNNSPIYEALLQYYNQSGIFCDMEQT
jgi:DNA replication ATP-dependent helicase Dna2